MPNAPLTRGEVARLLGVSTTRVMQLEDDLKPTRTANGTRLYDPAVVERVRRERAKVKESRRAAR